MRRTPSSVLAALTPKSRHGDLALAVVIVAVVGLMVVPLPTWLLDLLLAGNVTASIAIVLVTLYVPTPLRLTAFPTLLLVTTLVRLGLNVSSTRLILLQADAGEVIRSFGSFVVASSPVVGAVVFFILAIIQLVVIAKGSERVAEVGARFTLDAMPGKQLAIDAELKAGILDRHEARARRRDLDRASQFYGAMDGAMKFVRGDVIASLIITAVNIPGVLAMGIGARGLGLPEAARLYGLLTIGDGLVSQLPALLLASAAGILVTRVASEDGVTAVGEDLSVQLSSSPRALRTAAAFVLLLGVVPGLPLLPFGAAGVALLLLAVLSARRAPRPPAAPAAPAEAPDPGFVPVVASWEVEVAPALASVGATDPEQPGLARACRTLQDRMFAELGVPLPAALVRVGERLAGRTAALRVRELPAGGVLELGEGSDPAATEARLVELALPRLRRRAGSFLGASEVQQLLTRLERVRPGASAAVVPERLSVARLCEVLRRLVDEGVSIRDLSAVLDALASRADLDDPLELAEHVRERLSEATTHRLTGGEGRIAVLCLDRIVEDTIEEAITTTPAGRFLALAPAAARDIVTAVQDAADGHPDAVILTRPEIRRFVRRLLETRLPDLPVVSFAELSPEVTLETRATVRVA